LDAGSSTGGFTDCLLQAGAQLVYAVDVGSNQLHHSLIHHTQVRSFENKDIRMLDISELDNQPVDLIVADLSFISITRVIDSFLRLSTLDADWILLIKPQFETGKKKNYKKGIIKRTDEREQIIEPVIQAFLEQGLVVKEILATEAQADKKNIEYLVWIQRKK
jgi:23S rRNA (cytidine1920-2'-O)/16S rRNA (cytidine1409-2'-O)-methyltransferase